MYSKEYEERLEQIRSHIITFIDDLWDIPENKECFTYKQLTDQVIEDILNGYNG